MTSTTAKLISIVALVAVAAIFFVTMFSSQPESADRPDSQASRSPASTAEQVTAGQNDNGGTTEGISDSPGNSGGEVSDANVELAQEKWKISRGYLTEESRYLRRESDEQLEALIAQGNIQALRILASRQLSKDPSKMIGMLEEAVVQGDIPALLTAAGSWSSLYVHITANSFYVSVRPDVNTLALILTAQLRGDNVLAPQQLDQAFTDYNYDDQSVQEACKAARALYLDLEKERLDQGYPPFDNTPSPYGRPFKSGDYISATCGRSI